MNGDGVEEWKEIVLASTKKQKIEILKHFVRKYVDDKRTRGYILASLGEL